MSIIGAALWRLIGSPVSKAYLALEARAPFLAPDRSGVDILPNHWDHFSWRLSLLTAGGATLTALSLAALEFLFGAAPRCCAVDSFSGVAMAFVIGAIMLAPIICTGGLVAVFFSKAFQMRIHTQHYLNSMADYYEERPERQEELRNAWNEVQSKYNTLAAVMTKAQKSGREPLEMAKEQYEIVSQQYHFVKDAHETMREITKDAKKLERRSKLSRRLLVERLKMTLRMFVMVALSFTAALWALALTQAIGQDMEPIGLWDVAMIVLDLLLRGALFDIIEHSELVISSTRASLNADPMVFVYTLGFRMFVSFFTTAILFEYLKLEVFGVSWFKRAQRAEA